MSSQSTSVILAHHYNTSAAKMATGKMNAGRYLLFSLKKESRSRLSDEQGQDLHDFFDFSRMKSGDIGKCSLARSILIDLDLNPLFMYI